MSICQPILLLSLIISVVSQVDIQTQLEHRNDQLSELVEATSKIPAKVNSVAVMLYTYQGRSKHLETGPDVSMVKLHPLIN